MVPPELWLLVGALVAFTASLWLVSQRGSRGVGAFARWADEAGWDHDHAARPGVLPEVSTVIGIGPLADAGLYLAGPSAAGPFQLVRVRRPHDDSEWTLVHLRVPRAVSGLWVRPAPRFAVVARHDARPRDAFTRRFVVEANDADAAELLDGSLMAHLVRPGRLVTLGWQGHDLVVAFPFGVRSPEGAVALVRYASAVVTGATPQPAKVPAVTPVQRGEPMTRASWA